MKEKVGIGRGGDEKRLYICENRKERFFGKVLTLA